MHKTNRRRKGSASFRLVATVAAMAMLATSAIAGTAFATDEIGDDQTVQDSVRIDSSDSNVTVGDDGTAEDTADDGDTDGAADAGARDDATDAAQGGADDGIATQADDGTAATADSSGAVLLDEDFTGSSVSDEVTFYGTACLTAATSGSDYYCDGTKSVTSGVQQYRGVENGYLQLTDDSNSDYRSYGSQTGTVLYNRPIQSRYGLDIEFDTWQFSTENINGDGDGIGFFLTNGEYELDEQGPMGSDFGGALGYSAIADGNGTEPGIANGVLGIGLDVYGNYSSTKDVGGSDVRGSDSLHANSVTVRGAGAQSARGEWTMGYGIIADWNGDGRLSATKRSGWSTESLLTTDEPGVGREVGHEDDATHVHIVLSPLQADGTQTLTVTVTDGDNYSVSDIWTLTTPLPTLVKFGFSASTGMYSSAHFIRGVKVSTVESPESDILMTKTVRRDGEGATDQTVFSSGDTVPYDFTVQNIGGYTLSDIAISDEHAMDGDIVCEATTLEPGEQTQCHGSLTLSDEDVAGGVFTNTATASGLGDDGWVTSTSSVDITTIEPMPAPDHTKRIGANEDGTYTLALDVTGAQTTTVIPGQADPLDVVLVLDTSGSMNYGMDEVYADDLDTGATYVINSGTGSSQEVTYSSREGSWGYSSRGSWQSVLPARYDGDTGDWWNGYRTQFYRTTRLQALKDAVTSFIDGTEAANAEIEDAADKISVSIVTFGSNSNTRAALTVCEGDGADLLRNVIGGLSATGATNAGAGMQSAYSVLGGDGASDDAAKVAIFFTDGVPTTGTDFSTSVANTAVTAAGDIKTGLNGTVYSIGIFDGADPSVASANNNSSETAKANTFMNAVSSNYPNASAWNVLGDRVGQDAAYYKAASNAGDLSEIFEQIGHEITVPQGYSGVTITDTLSEYAQLTDEAGIVTDSSTCTDDGYCVVTDAGDNGVRVVAQAEGGEETTLDASAYTLYWNASTRSIRVAFDGTLADKTTYRLYFDVEPTAQAYLTYETSGYGDAIGDEGTDLYETVTSSGQPGFRTNVTATVTYNGESSTYAHPVLQVSVTPAEYAAADHLDLYKRLSGDLPLAAGMFDFELSDATAEVTGTACDGMQLPQTLTVGNAADEDGDGLAPIDDFGTLTFTKSGTFYVKVVETVPQEGDEGYQAGVAYDPRMLVVKYEVTSTNGVLQIAHRSVHVSEDGSTPSDWSAVDWIAADLGQDTSLTQADLTWTNTYVAVSSLPLTGGDTTARSLALAGGALLLLAGAAWALARRRRA